MAERRMFAKTIIDSDAFIDMPVTARLLYYDLSMRADDDGFVNSPKKIMRMIGASQDDLMLLISKKFLIPFESGVVVIKHWRIHNYIRKDTYNETTYKDEKAMLTLDENKAYKLTCDEPVYEPSTQVRLGKDSLGKDINTLSAKPDDLTIKAKLVLDALNQKTGKAFKYTDSNLRLIEARLKDYTVEDCLKVIGIKCSQWKNDPQMNKYLRPETLFNATKFGGYLNEQEVKTSPQYTGYGNEEDPFEC